MEKPWFLAITILMLALSGCGLSKPAATQAPALAPTEIPVSVPTQEPVVTAATC